MPKGIDPKAYAARITKAKKTVAALDPATKAKLKEMYPNISKEAIANKALTAKKTAAKPMAKSVAKTTAKPTTKPKVKPKTPTMPKKEKPAVGADIAAKKKYGPNSHNNGYTN